LPGKIGDPGATAHDNHLFVEAVLWVGADRRTLAGSAAGLWQVVHRLHALLALGQKARLGADFQGFVG
jgi:hypothetical protein